MTARVDYVESVDSAVCGKHTVFLTLEQVFGRMKSLSVYRSTSMLAGKFFARTFRTPTGSCFTSQQGRIDADQRTCIE